MSSLTSPIAVVLIALWGAQTESALETSDLVTEPKAPAEEMDQGELFVRANAAYEEGDYSQSIELYHKVLAAGTNSGYLHFNLGNAYLRNGELGQAIAAYHRCQARQPRDEDVKANLNFARRSTRDAIAPPQPSAVLRTLFFWHYGLSRSELLAAVVVINLLLWSSLVWRLYRRGSEVLRWAFIAALLLLLATGGSLVVRVVDPTRIAVIIPQEIEVHSGTSLDTVVRFKLHAGTELRAVDTRDGWIRITLPDGQQGWIEAKHAELVEL